LSNSIKHGELISILKRSICIVLATLICSAAQAKEPEKRRFQAADIHRLKVVGDIALSPDGQLLAYSVTTSNIDKDTSASNLFMVNWDGSNPIQLTHDKDAAESHPRFSPDGMYLAFIASRSKNDSEKSDEPADKAQVWLLNRAGGEAHRLTALAGGVSSYEWSPDSQQLVLVSSDPEKKVTEDEGKSKEKHKTPKPIVIDRYQFKKDVSGYLGNRYERLYVFDIKTRVASLLTEGNFDSSEPAWSPDGDLIAFSSRREGDPDRHANSDIYVIEAIKGAKARKLTSWEGPDYTPVFSPDGKQIAYLQGGPPKYSDYDPAQLAVVAVASGDIKLPSKDLDRNISSPEWSADGQSLYFLVADNRTQSIKQVPVSGGNVEQVYPSGGVKAVVESFKYGPHGIATVTTFARKPAEIYRATDGKALSNHNSELVEAIEWATVEAYDSIGKDGQSIGSMLLKPPGFRKGKAYPTIAYVHGGPVSQDAFEFDATSQVLAAQGYLVVNTNYRGSSGRGKTFSRAIYADWGKLEIQDIHAVMDQLVEEGLADPKRLGIGGWSYGGMNTNYAIATDTRFSAAVSGASISNMITGYGTDQYIQQYENEFGLPWDSIDAYLKASYPFFHADRIKTPTLFMCGEKDFNVPLSNSEQMYQALRSLNVPTRLVIYPGQFHGLTKPSYIQDRLERMIEWYGKYLGKPKK
jgi:dipeptidyl aminopeptidase/acylaminoacyl peptidase